MNKNDVDKYFVAETGDDDFSDGLPIANTGGDVWILTREQMPGNDEYADAEMIAEALNLLHTVRSSRNRMQIEALQHDLKLLNVWDSSRR